MFVPSSLCQSRSRHEPTCVVIQPRTEDFRRESLIGWNVPGKYEPRFVFWVREVLFKDFGHIAYARSLLYFAPLLHNPSPFFRVPDSLVKVIQTHLNQKRPLQPSDQAKYSTMKLSHIFVPMVAGIASLIHAIPIINCVPLAARTCEANIPNLDCLNPSIAWWQKEEPKVGYCFCHTKDTAEKYLDCFYGRMSKCAEMISEFEDIFSKLLSSTYFALLKISQKRSGIGEVIDAASVGMTGSGAQREGS